MLFLCLVAYGGDNSSASDLKQVQAICGSYGAFAALKKDGTVESWGDKGYKKHTMIVILEQLTLPLLSTLLLLRLQLH